MKRYFFVLLVLLVLALIVPLPVRPLISPDETRYIEIAREMLQNNDWIVPRLNGVRYFEKPVMGYWAFAGSMKLFGENAFALRLVSALSMLICGFFLYFLMRKAGCRKREAILAFSISMTMPMVAALSSVGILDGLFTCFLTLSTGFFFLAYQYTEHKFRKGIGYFLCGIFMGCAVLTKGFLGFILPGITIAGYLAWNKKWKDILLLPWLPLFASLAVIAPWAILIHRAEPDYWHYFIVVEHWHRFSAGDAAQHSEPFFYFIPVLLGGIAPWLLLLPCACAGLRKEILQTPLCRFALCWAALPFLLFSIASGKLASYILPCMFPLAVLIAHGLTRWTQAPKWNRLPEIAGYVLGGLLVASLLVLSVNFFTGFPVAIYERQEVWKWTLLLICGGLAAFLLFMIRTEKNHWRRLRIFPVALLILTFGLQFAFPQYMAERKCPQELMDAVRIEKDKKVVLVSHGNPFQAVCWHFKRDDVYMTTPNEIEYGLKYPEHKHRLIDPGEFDTFVKEQKEAGADSVILFIRSKRYHRGVEGGTLFQGEPKRHIHGRNEDFYCFIEF